MDRSMYMLHKLQLRSSHYKETQYVCNVAFYLYPSASMKNYEN